MASETAPHVTWQQIFTEAVSIHSEAPGTVCVSKAHYENGRHPQPYRMGYHHGDPDRVPDHWHVNENEYLRCKREAG